MACTNAENGSMDCRVGGDAAGNGAVPDGVDPDTRPADIYCRTPCHENLNADVKIKRMELTVWKTFPYMTIDVDGLNVRSRTLDKHKASLPAGVDSLLDVGCIRAQFNLARLALMDVEIKEIFVDSPKVNLVTVNDSLNNYMIVPPSKEKSESTPIVLKSLVLEHLNIVNNRGIRYRDLKSGMDFTLHTDTLSLNFKDKENAIASPLEATSKQAFPKPI